MLRLHFLNVENGDCIIIEHEDGGGRTFGLIDCNRTPSRDSPARDKLIELGAEKLEFVCITHPDKDHYFGILDVLKYYHGRIGSFLTFPLASFLVDREKLKEYAAKVVELAKISDDEDVFARHLEFVEILSYASKNFQNNWLEVTGDYDLMGVSGFGGAQFYGIGPPKRMRGSIPAKVLDPNSFTSIDNNDVSVAILIKYGDKSIILGGDSPDENWIWHRSYRKKVNLSILSDVVKIPHHGSQKDNSSQTLSELLTSSDETIAVLSANGRGHPDIRTMADLETLGCQRLCTNLFNPNSRSLKRIYNNEALSSRLRHWLNVYSTPLPDRASPCKGDIVVEVSPTGTIQVMTEFSSVCPCSVSAGGFTLPVIA